MELRVLGCHGGETPSHKTSAFLIDDRLALDAGSITRSLTLDEQRRLKACVISHAHLDHIRDLATLADNRCQTGCEPLIVAGTAGTLRALEDHFFNGVLWPDFRKIPSESEPTLRFVELPMGGAQTVEGYEIESVPVNHTIESAGFIIRAGASGSIAYSGDTGPTDEFWKRVSAEADLRGLLVEVSFPNRQQDVATLSGHHTPKTLHADLLKLQHPGKVPAFLYHIKPSAQAEVERECARLDGVDLSVLSLDDHFVL